MNSSTATTTRRARGSAPGRVLRAVLTGLSDRAHAVGDAQAQAMGWAVTPVPGPLGLNGRAYRHTGLGPAAAARRGEYSRDPEARPRHPLPAGQPRPAAGRQDSGDG